MFKLTTQLGFIAFAIIGIWVCFEIVSDTIYAYRSEDYRIHHD